MLPNVCILFIFIFRSFSFGSLDKCTPFQIKLKHFNKKLVGHSIAEVSDLGNHDCVRECMALSACKSFDYFGPKKTCKLNDVESASIDISEFKPLDGAIFSDISDWPSSMVGSCGPRPCAAYQRCIQDMENYFCQDIFCGNVPLIENAKVTLSAPDKTKFLDTASVECNPAYFSTKERVKCQLSETWEKLTCIRRVSDCKDILQGNPGSDSGVYDVFLWNSEELLSVYCDMETDGGGWTVFQKRFDGLTHFYRNYSEYQNGFGSVDGEFWLGLKNIQEIAEQDATEMRIGLSKADGTEGYATFQDFSLTGPEYKLMFDNRTSGIAESLHGSMFPNLGAYFSTYDHDRDTDPNLNCAFDREGAWWYKRCTDVNLNGRYCTPGTACSKNETGFIYEEFAQFMSLKTSCMMLRRVK